MPRAAEFRQPAGCSASVIKKRSAPAEWTPGPRLPLSVSAKVVACVKAWMEASGVRSTYELSLLVDVPRATLHRWFSGDVCLPVQAVQSLIDDLADHAAATSEAHDALAELLRLAPTPDPWEARLYAELRNRGVRIKGAMAAVYAAGLRLVPADDNQEETHDPTSP